MTHPNGRSYSPEFGTQGGIFSREKTHCVNGHEFTEENTVWKPRKSRNPKFPDSWMRQCRECLNQANRDYRARKAIERAWAEVMEEMS